MSLIPQLLARSIRADVQGLKAYPVQSSQGLIKLDTMENPFRLPAELQQALGERLGAVALNRYPAEHLNVLRAALAAHAQMPEGCDICLGNGSDEIISMLSLACNVPGAVHLSPVPSFVMYAMVAQLQGARFVGVPLLPDFELDGPAMLHAIAEQRPNLIYLAYPNNPTGSLWNDAVIEQVIEAAAAVGALVVMDEAYQPFATQDSLPRLRRHEHVLIMRTLSKFGLAGVRIGYLMGRTALIQEIEKLRPPFNVGVLNIEAALFALEHVAEYQAQAATLREQRGLLFTQLQALVGVTPYPSQGNMILLRVPDAARTFEGMKARGVLVKNVSAMHPSLANCLRITVSHAQENEQMLAALKASL